MGEEGGQSWGEVGYMEGKWKRRSARENGKVCEMGAGEGRKEGRRLVNRMSQALRIMRKMCKRRESR